MLTIRLWALPLAIFAIFAIFAVTAPASHAAQMVRTTLRIDISDIAPGERVQVERRVDRAIREFCRSEASNIDLRARRAVRRCVARLRKALAEQLDARDQLAAMVRR